MTMRAALGWWLVGVIGSAVIGAGIGYLIWSEARKNTEHLEGGWTRVVTDESVQYSSYAIPTALILLALWTLGMVAYALIERGSK